MREKGDVPDMRRNRFVNDRAESLYHDAKFLVEAIERDLDHPYSPEGFYKIFAAGFLPVPYLWEGREEFAAAVNWKTRLVNGGMVVVDDSGNPVSLKYRGEISAYNLKKVRLPLV